MSCLHCGMEVPVGLGKQKNRIRKFCSTKCTKYYWASKNKEQVKLKQLQRHLQNPEKRALVSRTYYLKNKAYYAEYASLRNRTVKQATPGWANKDDIHNVYLEAQYMQLEVDHIIPLKHPLVCGLHVWDNLQLLSRSENARKNNKFDSDILAVIE